MKSKYSSGVTLSGSYTVPNGATGMILYVELPGANTDQGYYIDDVLVRGEKTTIQLNDKYESDFEDGTTQSWNGRGSATVERSTKYAHSGTTSLYVSGRTQLWNGATRSASDIMEAGGYYKVGTYVLYDGASYSDTQKFSINLQYDLNGKEIITPSPQKLLQRENGSMSAANSRYRKVLPTSIFMYRPATPVLPRNRI